MPIPLPTSPKERGRDHWVLRHNIQPRDRAMAADKRRQEVAMADERGHWWWKRGNKSGSKRWPARWQIRGDKQWSDLTISHKIGLRR